jgi:hypothetical protein
MGRNIKSQLRDRRKSRETFHSMVRGERNVIFKNIELVYDV